MELAPEFSIRAKVLRWSQKEPAWRPVLRHKGDIPELALQLLLIQSVPLTRTNLQILISNSGLIRPWYNSFLKRGGGQHPHRTKMEVLYLKKYCCIKNGGRGGKRCKGWGEEKVERTAKAFSLQPIAGVPIQTHAGTANALCCVCVTPTNSYLSHGSLTAPETLGQFKQPHLRGPVSSKCFQYGSYYT